MHGANETPRSPRLHDLLKKRGYFDLSQEERLEDHEKFVKEANNVQRGNMNAGRKLLRDMRGGLE